MQARAVVLAAGASTRMGSQKLLLPFRGRPLIDYALDAAREFAPIVVAGSGVAAFLRNRSVDVLLNENPERGMAHSLALANEAASPACALIVLLGDKPLVTHDLIARVREAARGADVAFPVHSRTHEPGHPVVFSPRARAKIASLPDGDSLRNLRDDPSLKRREIVMDDPGAYVDIDTADALE